MTHLTKTQSRILWTAIGLLSLAFTAAGAAKLLGAAPLVAEFERIGLGQWFRFFTGALELLGVAFLWIPRTRFFGALWLGGIMIGAIITHTLVGGSPVPAMILGLLATTAAWHTRPTSLR